MLIVQVAFQADPELDAESSERLVRQLRAELVERDGVESAAYSAGGTVPPGAKAADPVTVGALVIALSASGGVFAGLVETLRDWLGRSAARHRISVTIDGDTIELERATAGQQLDLIDAFLRRHCGE